MEYKVRNNHNGKTVKTFNSLEDAIIWADKHMNKYGQRVTHIENGCMVTDYDNAMTAMAKTNEKHRANCKQGGSL